MGIYLNPPADAFEAILREKIYVDKSGLISYANSVLNSSRMLTCLADQGALENPMLPKCLPHTTQKVRIPILSFKGLKFLIPILTEIISTNIMSSSWISHGLFPLPTI